MSSRVFTLALAACMAAPLLAQMQPHLIPMPREAHLGASTSAASVLVVVGGDNADDQRAGEDLSEALKDRGVMMTPNVGAPALTVTLLRANSDAGKAALAAAGQSFDPAMQAEGYVLVSKPGSVTIVGGTSAGVFYGVQTLKQMLTGSGQGATVATGTVRDWPALRYRGIDDDLSRGPFPTLAFQEQQIRAFAAFKVNIYSPYFEDTQQYAGDVALAPPGRSLTRAEAQELVQYAARYHVMIVPEQEAFGHLHKLLRFEKYNDLAENPHGDVLAPGQNGTQALIKSWFTQLAEDYPSPFLHVGADETESLGTGRTQAAVQQQGLGAVYSQFLTQIHSTLEPLHRKLLFWGDIAWNDPQAVAGLPKDMIAIPWIYWHEDNYDKNILPFKNAGIETWVAPGDANWSMMYPLGATALDNISGFIEAGQRLGSTGSLTTVWNDDGEGLFNQDWFGVMFGAAAAWQPGRSSGSQYQASFGQDFYNDMSGRIMQAEQELMDAQTAFDTSDDVFWIDPWSPAGQAMATKLRPTLHDARLHAERAMELIDEALADDPNLRHTDALRAMELGARRIDFAAMKFQFSDEMVDAYSKAYAMHNDPKQRKQVGMLLESMTGTNGRTTDLRDGYVQLKELYSAAWLAENRPAWLGNITVKYDLATQLWEQRAERMHDVIETWEHTHTLPTAREIGLPGDSVAAPAPKATKKKHKGR